MQENLICEQKKSFSFCLFQFRSQWVWIWIFGCYILYPGSFILEKQPTPWEKIQSQKHDCVDFYWKIRDVVDGLTERSIADEKRRKRESGMVRTLLTCTTSSQGLAEYIRSTFSSSGNETLFDMLTSRVDFTYYDSISATLVSLAIVRSYIL